MRAADFGGADHLVLIDRSTIKADILPHRSGDQHIVLHRRADQRAQFSGRILAHVRPVDHDHALFGLVEAEHQPRERRLARSDTAQKADSLARLNDQIDAVQRSFRRPGIAKSDIAQFDRAIQSRGMQRIALRPLRRRVHQRADLAVSDARRGETGQQGRDLRQRRQRPAAQDRTGEQRAGRDLIAAQQAHAHDDDAAIGYGRGAVGDRHRHGRCQPLPQRAFGMADQRRLPPSAQHRPRADRLDRFQTADRFHQH